MPKASLVGVDSAGGIILGPGSSKAFVGGIAISLIGDAIAPHGKSPHSGAVIVTASNKLIIEGKPTTRAGSLASCGHTATGSSKINLSS